MLVGVMMIESSCETKLAELHNHIISCKSKLTFCLNSLKGPDTNCRKVME